jgi:hypothetical protein
MGRWGDVKNEGHFPYFLQGGVIHKKVGPDFPAETFRILKEKWVRIGSSKTLLANHWDDLERTVHTGANG